MASIHWPTCFQAAAPLVAFTPIMRYFKKNKENITNLLDAYLSLRGIIIQKTKLTSDCTKIIKQVWRPPLAPPLSPKLGVRSAANSVWHRRPIYLGVT